MLKKTVVEYESHEIMQIETEKKQHPTVANPDYDCYNLSGK